MKGYPTEKPAAVAEVLVSQSTKAGELVIDPFAGSGAFGVAATAAGRRFAGADTCAEAIRIATERLNAIGQRSRGLQAVSSKTLGVSTVPVRSNVCRLRNIAT
jgi:DNA modification methylase